MSEAQAIPVLREAPRIACVPAGEGRSEIMKALPILYCGVVTTMAVLAAQTPSPTQRRTTLNARSASQANQPVTVTGCVTPADNPSTASLTHFVLSHVEPAVNVGVPSSSESDESRATAVVSGYALSPASSEVNLKDHLSHRVEITGTVDSAAPQTTASQHAASSESSGSLSSARTTMPSLRVSAVKMVSTSCP
jgi:hypothetical protein